MLADSSPGEPLPLDRVHAAWRRFTTFVIRIAGIGRLWGILGNYLKEIKGRGRVEEQPSASSSQPPSSSS